MDRPATELPERRGLRPRTQLGMPHQQLDQNAPAHLQEQLYERARSLPGVSAGPSMVSVPGARAFFLAEELAAGPPEAFMAGREFGHLHPAYDGSLHLAIPEGLAAEVERKGWGELHPAARMGMMPGTAAMVFGPRDEEELEVVWVILKASYDFARGRRSGSSGA